MPTTVADAIAIMNELAPPYLAMPDDKNGLSAGAPTQKISRIIVALDAAIETLRAAPREALIITHHPRFYHGLTDLRADTFNGAAAELVSQKKLALFNAHTNLDIAPGGVNDHLAELCGLTAPRVITITHRLPIFKLVVFVPAPHCEKVIAAISGAGAGKMGDYEQCVYTTSGEGQFRPTLNARPFIGQRGELCRVAEIRLETVVPFGARGAVESALRAAHPYEEPAYDFIATEKTENFGLGRAGELSAPTTLSAFAAQVKKALGADVTLYTGAEKKPLKSVAVWSGSGAAIDDLPPVDVLVTGELDYHRAEVLAHKKIAAIVVGHAASECHIVPALQKKLRAKLRGITITTNDFSLRWRGI